MENKRKRRSLISAITMFLQFFVVLLGLCPVTLASVVRRQAYTNPDSLWPNGVIPYIFHPQVEAFKKIHLLAAMKQLMISTFSNGQPCLTFVPRTNETDYVEIKVDPAGYTTYYGRISGKQTLSIGQEINHSFVLRHMMHLLGIFSGVSRQDRDKYLEVVSSNIGSNYAIDFIIQPNTYDFQLPFDFNSVILRDPYAFATDRSMPTTRAKVEGQFFGEAVSLSPGDVMMIQHTYNCHVDTSHNIDLFGPLIFECHFHENLCSFVNDNTNDFDWVFRKGPGINGTGPRADQSSGSGGYALAVSRGHFNQSSRLVIPELPSGVYCYSMGYYMNRKDIDTLTVKQKNAKGTTTLLTITEPWGKGWNRYRATVNSQKSPVTLTVEAAMGNGDFGDIAIDDVVVYNGKCIDWF